MKYLVFLFFIISLISKAQTSVNKIEVSNWFDELVGYDALGLSNGKNYYDISLGKTLENTHVFYLKNKPIKGSLIYNGNFYSDIYLKYDIFLDELIYAAESNIGTMQLIKDLIEQFQLNNSKFYHIKNLIIDNKNLSGFLELLFIKNDIKIYKKNYKKKINKIVNDKLRYKFNNDATYILFKNGYNFFNSKKDIKKVFPDKKMLIKNFHKEKVNQLLLKDNPDAFTKKIIVLLLNE